MVKKDLGNEYFYFMDVPDRRSAIISFVNTTVDDDRTRDIQMPEQLENDCEFRIFGGIAFAIGFRILIVA